MVVGILIVGVISDTHVPSRAPAIPRWVLEGLRGVDLILHAGDLVEEGVLRLLEEIAPVEAVAGNMDPPNLQLKLGRRKLLSLGGFNVGLIHGDGNGYSRTPQRAYAAFRDADCIVFGHTHQPLNQRNGKTLLFNPGSPTDTRCDQGPSYGVLYVDKGIRGEIIFGARRL